MYVSSEIMQAIHKNMGPPGLITPGYNLVSTWAHFSLPARPLCRQALIVATIFHTSLYLHLAVLCHTDVRLGYVTCFGQGLSNIPDAKRGPLGQCHCLKNKPAGG